MSLLLDIADLTELRDTFGDTLTFSTFTIQGILGFITTQLQDNTHFTKAAEEQTFSIYALASDVKLRNLIGGMTFTYTDNVYTYSFLILNNPIPSTNGWYRIVCNITSIV